MNRTALITGAGSGIGAATARQLATLGHELTLLDLDEAALTALARDLERNGTRVHPVVGDVADEEVMRSAVRAAAGEAGRLDVLHLNAGRSGVGPLTGDTDLADVRATVGTNLLGVLTGLVAALPALAAAQGSVIVTSSLAGVIGSPADPVYAATKHALVGLVRSCAPLFAAENVRIDAVCPSLVDTALVPEADSLRAAGLPVLRPEDVAVEVVRLLMETHDTGTVLVMEGGRDPAVVPEPVVSALQGE